jgi:SOS-response transcriptional repressor LexA
MGFKSVYAVTVHLKALIRKEWIWMVPNQSRNIRLREE